MSAQYAAKTRRLYLEPLSEKHIDGFHAIWSSKETLSWSRHPPTTSISESLAFLRSSTVDKDSSKYAILLQPSPSPSSTDPRNPKMIGILGTVDAGKELVYMLHCEYWGKGYMPEALVVFVGSNGLFWRLPESKEINTLKARIDTENLASEKTILKVGARKGEILKRAYELARDRVDGVVEEAKKRDIVIWYIDRPEVGRN